MNPEFPWPSLFMDYIHSRHLFLTIREAKIRDPYYSGYFDKATGGDPVLSVRTILLWWLKNFREATEVHFDELTLTVHLLDVTEVAEVWGLLDGVLSSDVFGDVDEIHFENWEGDRIDVTSDSDMAGNILSVLPQLAQRHVFDFKWTPE